MRRIGRRSAMILMNQFLPATGRWRADGVTEGRPQAMRLELPLHHALRSRSPSPGRGGMAL
ncbi:hypothetical protein EAH84_07795 [Sphingomonas oligophenolica]|uniref:Uncharacterized protein n=1 Tax=Sphingomonas oligophenolica TaxID=301154 RepID=A0A502CG24_9SPHN|nr:hypothetical protein EAH84_07795 [Sphingomonas oligophenolica]